MTSSRGIDGLSRYILALSIYRVSEFSDRNNLVTIISNLCGLCLANTGTLDRLLPIRTILSALLETILLAQAVSRPCDLPNRTVTTHNSPILGVGAIRPAADGAELDLQVFLIIIIIFIYNKDGTFRK